MQTRVTKAKTKAKAAGGSVRKLERNCSIARTVSILSDGWVFMILRECYFGVDRFDSFQKILGLPRATLIARLRKLTEQGLLHKAQYSPNPPRYEYRLTRIGFDLYPVMIALMRFGDKWLAGTKGPPLDLIHTTCGHHCHPLIACSHCGEEVLFGSVVSRDGTGAGRARPYAWASRRSADPTVLERRRPSMVARALKFIGDRWTLMVLREALFHDVSRFDDFRTRLGIAPNILADRLARLAREEVFQRVPYQSSPERFEYLLTDRGRDLSGPLLAMLHWGDRWLSGGKPPLILKHLPCKQDFSPLVVCDYCRQPVQASDMKYRMHYRMSELSAEEGNTRALK